MPQMNGRQLADCLLRLKPELEVLFISGYTGGALDNVDVEESWNFLQKPFTPDALAQKVGEILERA
jgi:two-component SAPR family response regulator